MASLWWPHRSLAPSKYPASEMATKASILASILNVLIVLGRKKKCFDCLKNYQTELSYIAKCQVLYTKLFLILGILWMFSTIHYILHANHPDGLTNKYKWDNRANKQYCKHKNLMQVVWLLPQPGGVLQGDRQSQSPSRLLHVPHLCVQGPYFHQYVYLLASIFICICKPVWRGVRSDAQLSCTELKLNWIEIFLFPCFRFRYYSRSRIYYKYSTEANEDRKMSPTLAGSHLSVLMCLHCNA